MHSNRSNPSQIRVSQSYTAIPGYPVSYGKILKWYQDTLLAMGKILKWYPDTLLARYSGTMHHHAKDFFWPRGRRGRGGCCYSGSQQQ